MKKADLICDLQFGSTGKGLIAGYLSKKFKYDTIITCNMPNAGHTFIDRKGVKYVHHVIGNGIVGPDVEFVMVGPGSVFNVEQLFKEVRFARENGLKFTTVVHANAWTVNESHREKEASLVSEIGSTGQGSAEAMYQKISRRSSNIDNMAGMVLPSEQDTCNTLNIRVIGTEEWDELIKSAGNILIEGSQGYSLGINAGFYPYCTSRDCNPNRILADAQVPHTELRFVYGTCRVHPIRVGGNSGPGYSDQRELHWDEVGVAPELTTTTGRERRIFTFSIEQMRRALYSCQPNKIFLNFCNYDPKLAQNIADLIEDIGVESVYNFYGVRYKGFGATEGDIVDTDWREHEPS